MADHVLEVDFLLNELWLESPNSVTIMFLFIFLQICDPLLGSLILFDDWVVEDIFNEFYNLFELLEGQMRRGDNFEPWLDSSDQLYRVRSDVIGSQFASTEAFDDFLAAVIRLALIRFTRRAILLNDEEIL